MAKAETWTITCELVVFAGNMSKENVIQNAEQILKDITDGTDFANFAVIDAKQDDI